MKAIFKSLVTKAAIIAIASTFSVSALAQENERALDLDALLKQLEEGKFSQTQQNQAREQDFINQRAEQDRILQETRARRDALLQQSEQLETSFEENEFKLADLNGALDNRLGSLKELFGVLQQVAGDTKNKFYNSVISAQIPNRAEFLDEMAQSMGSSSKLASIDEIERVWFEIQREMTESGKVTKFTTDVVEAGGEKVTKEVTRVGPFAIVADGKYLEYNSTTETVSELTRQPADRFLESITELENSNGELVGFGLDPTGGSILGLLVQAPSLWERVEQGGLVGYIILIVGAVGLLLALERLISLSIIRTKVNKQLKSDTFKNTNPLGRVMQVRDKYPHADVEALELHLTEAILGEVPKLSRFLTIIKIISVVAPLMGLLGTVTGMINTFQAITLFGTGDPKLMAGGISQALVTTVLGLVVAIPTTLLYAILNTRSKNIVYILQEQASGVIAERAEKATQASQSN
uniref:MotA/TolQ/ExbB proton channel family protein n=1 Tax=Ningiella ruwaisensis TaxID=2364274 RepID=UPI00109FC165|nr:MotA/TolQ/ExbB proton channel family protein [Ningiella ruwaisensis]